VRQSRDVEKKPRNQRIRVSTRRRDSSGFSGCRTQLPGDAGRLSPDGGGIPDFRRTGTAGRGNQEFAVMTVIPVKESIRLRIEEFGIVPAIKPKLHESAADDAIFAAETLNAAGIPIAEIKWAVPGALDVVSHLAKKFPKMVVGADILDLEAAERCVDAGA